MNIGVNLGRRFAATSLKDFLLECLRFVAVVYVIGFGVYLPVVKFTQLTGPVRHLWFGLYVVALLFTQAFQYLPKSSDGKWKRLEAARLAATTVAVAKIAGCIRESRFSGEDFLDIAHRLLVVTRQEVEAITLDTDGTSINATLMTEEPSNPQILRVRSRANSDRGNPSYKKKDMTAGLAMELRRRQYVPNFTMQGKSYRCILACPLVIEVVGGDDVCIGVVSIDSSRAGDFDGVEQTIETRILPCLGLLKMALVMEKTGDDGYRVTRDERVRGINGPSGDDREGRTQPGKPRASRTRPKAAPKKR